ncbi:Outer membrane protein A precursor [hydrothermal vent metagenome]|uniref:Outer membrane protein A n=1 Tax=hydrothermal vent metagenome TaxID=652676 RepID=A0A3B0W253_9ZZZZ
MKIKLLPIAVAIVSATSIASFTAQADDHGAKTDAYVTDSYGNIVRDFWGDCARSTAWTPETAIASCEKNNSEPENKANNGSETVATMEEATTSVDNDINNDIKDNEKRGYVIDSDGYVVRDSWGACVRTIEWTVENEIARCEGKEEAKPEVAVVTPPPAPPVIKPAPVVVAPKPIPTIAQFRGFFDTESAVLKSSAYPDLDAYADFLTANLNSKITITGHTDSRGEASYNQNLSERRAKAAKEYLVNKGISVNRMETHGAGETSPIADNKTREGRAQNRRVEVELIK